MKLFKEIINDIYFASKVTNVGNKKLILFTVIILSQLTAFSDVALIVIFSAIITGTYEQGLIGPVVQFFWIIYTFSIVVILRFMFTYTQSMTMKAR